MKRNNIDDISLQALLETLEDLAVVLGTCTSKRLMSTFGIPGNFRLLYLHVTCELARHKAVKVMLHGRFATAIFSATQRCNDATMLQSFEVMSQQCCNVGLH